MSELRVLFVDDEPRILEGLKNRLRKKPWVMHFATSGPDALRLLAQHGADVVVTDMRMPGMDGAALLARVQTEHPEVVRIVLSGHAELEASMRALPVCHQYLAKPCDVGTLEAVIERSARLRSLVDDEALRRLIGGVAQLPTMPKTYAKLQLLLADPRTNLKQIAALIREDPALCAKLLQLTNSAFFRLARPISNVEDATRYLGLDTLKRLVLAAELFSSPFALEQRGISLRELQQHALVTGSIAAAIVPDAHLRDDAFVAGTLHDVGRLLLMQHLPEESSAALAAERESLVDAELRVFGVSHDRVGGYLLGLWGLPSFIVEAVAFHHQPMVVPAPTFGVLSAVHIANALALRLCGCDEAAPDPALMAALGLTGRFEAWLEQFEQDVGALTAAMVE